MCTVTFIKHNEQIIITSNRDENIARPIATSPINVIENGIQLTFPKDPISQGSWFIVNQFNHVFVLLNGAKDKHKSLPPYRLSRGIILKKIAASINFDSIWDVLDLTNIEPFTIVAYVSNNLFQLRWDGLVKEKKILNINEATIWSSATLYDLDVQNKRKEWFNSFLQQNQKINSDLILDFHTKTQISDSENGLLINRLNKMVTKNVTQCIIENNSFVLTHLDLIENKKYTLDKFSV